MNRQKRRYKYLAQGLPALSAWSFLAMATAYGAIAVVDPEKAHAPTESEYELSHLQGQQQIQESDYEEVNPEPPSADREARRQRWLTLTLSSIVGLAAFIALCVGAANSYLVHPVVVPELTDDFTAAAAAAVASEAVEGQRQFELKYEEDPYVNDDEIGGDGDDGDDTAVSQYKYDDDPYINNDDDVDDWPAPTPSPTRAPNHAPPSTEEPAYEPEPATSYAGFGKSVADTVAHARSSYEYDDDDVDQDDDDGGGGESAYLKSKSSLPLPDYVHDNDDFFVDDVDFEGGAEVADDDDSR